jgi:hypothetical protein
MHGGRQSRGCKAGKRSAKQAPLIAERITARSHLLLGSIGCSRDATRVRCDPAAMLWWISIPPFKGTTREVPSCSPPSRSPQQKQSRKAHTAYGAAGYAESPVL